MTEPRMGWRCYRSDWRIAERVSSQWCPVHKIYNCDEVAPLWKWKIWKSSAFLSQLACVILCVHTCVCVVCGRCPSQHHESTHSAADGGFGAFCWMIRVWRRKVCPCSCTNTFNSLGSVSVSCDVNFPPQVVLGLWLQNKWVWSSAVGAHADLLTGPSLGMSSSYHVVWGESGQQRLIPPTEEVNWISVYLISASDCITGD